ncbi:ABC transporter permease [Kineococcus rhizosphaerae]|uniref:NitT/TauT family transport system permease protein n=1 Tax=Kineococcus rhizosphaerae TaxID=559628 RepID=A0A2T0QX88_9ACTN|nr:ABC transporter permease subunit [Kineococcus rhizosphaerae]PRY10498.1 NitT/TauT family transport system permease protein [Kineococcus rhizosphaerae]
MRRVLTALAHYWPVLAVFVGWDLWIVLNGYTTVVAPRPGLVLADIAGNPGAYAGDLLRTLGTSVVGLVLGMAVGVLAAIAVWSSAAVAGVVTPAALVLRSVPVTAMVPIIARVAGYGDSSILVIIVVVSFFPAFVLTLSGLAATPAAGRDLFGVLGANRVRTLLRLHLPHAVPNVVVAFRLTAPSAVLAALLAEYLVGSGGLGHLFSTSRSYLDLERAWGTALLATVVSILTFVLARGVERRVTARFS